MGRATAELELTAGGGEGLAAKLSAILDGFAARHERSQARLMRRLEHRPVVVDLLHATPLGSTTSQPVIPASGVLTLVLGSPQAGLKWMVRTLRASDAASVTATVAGRGDWFAGQPAMTAAGTPTPLDWRWTMPTLPNVAMLPNDAFTVTDNDNLMFTISGGTAGQQLAVTATVVEYELAGRWDAEIGV
jgi:hypothetical protein